MEKDTKLPLTSETSLGDASEKQIKFLKDKGLWKEGMTGEEASAAIGSWKASLMQPGLHLAKIKSIKELIGFDGKPKKDSRGYPGISVTFINALKQTAEMAFFYDPAPLNAEHRADKSRRCASEFNLTNLRKAFGWNHDQPVTEDMIKKGYIWLPIARQEYVIKGTTGAIMVDKDNKPVFDIVPLSKFFPVEDKTKKVIIDGDPDLNKGVCGGIFLIVKEKEEKASTSGSTSPSQSSESHEEVDDTVF